MFFEFKKNYKHANELNAYGMFAIESILICCICGRKRNVTRYIDTKMLFFDDDCLALEMYLADIFKCEKELIGFREVS
jgi:hypothetical protein